MGRSSVLMHKEELLQSDYGSQGVLECDLCSHCSSCRLQADRAGMGGWERGVTPKEWVRG